MEEILNLLKELSKIEGVKITINGEEFHSDDSETKKKVEAFKKKLDVMDDDLFIEICEDLSELIDMSEFDKLINKDSYTKEEAKKVAEMIGFVSESIITSIDLKISKLEKIQNTFKVED